MLQEQYNHLSFEERENIRYLYINHGYSIRGIAYQLGRSPSTISRELQRNRNSQGQYGARSAHRMARERMYRKPTGGFILKNDMTRSYVIEHLHLGWSPGQISGRLPMDHPGNTISHETIYLFVYQEARRGWSDLYKCLPQRRKRRRKRYRGKTGAKYRNMTVISAKTPLSDRSEEANNRLEAGHWEFDTVIGRRNASAIAVGIERVSRKVYISPLIDKSAVSMRHAIVSILMSLPASLRRSMTVDNGSENAAHQSISRILDGMPVYFCESYKSWQKGAVEQVNGLIRRVFPKGTHFASVDPRDLLHLQRCLNTRPRKCLGWRTPDEVFSELCESEP